MYGFGGNAPVAGQPGLYALPFRADISGAAAALTVTVSSGLAKFGDTDVYERKAATDATTIAVPTTLGSNILYVNPTDALDANGDAIDSVGFTPEADIERTAINGSVGTTLGRSLAIAEVTVAAHTGTVTMAGAFADADTVTVTVGGVAVVTTLTAITAASVTTVATAVKAALEADAGVAALVTITQAAGVLTLTSKTAVAHALVAAEVTAGNGTATRSAATLTGGGVSSVDNAYRFKAYNKPRGREIR